MQVSVARLQALIELASGDGVESIDLIEDGTHIRITRSGDGVSRKNAVSPSLEKKPFEVKTDPNLFRAPMFGVLHLTPAPDVPPYVRVGDHVRKGQQLCWIEAMKMFSAITSDRDGKIDAILAEPGVEITTGQPLFRIVEG